MFLKNPNPIERERDKDQVLLLWFGFCSSELDKEERNRGFLNFGPVLVIGPPLKSNR